MRPFTHFDLAVQFNLEGGRCMIVRRWTSLLLVLALCMSVQWLHADDEETTPTKKKPDAEKAGPIVAEIKLTGSFDDAASSEGFSLFGGKSSGTLMSLCDRIKKAKSDEQVKALFLRFEGLSVSWGKANEILAAIKEFRKSGKKVYAYMESEGTMDYLIASGCDEIVCPPVGGVDLTGLHQEMPFMKDLLEKFGLKFEAVPIGDFKAAMENMTRSTMSPANRKQWEEIYDDWYAILVETIAANRPGMTPEKVRELIDAAPYTASKALANKLIDRVDYPDNIFPKIKADLQLQELALQSNYGKKKSDEVDLDNPFAILKLLAPKKEPKLSKNPKVAVIYATGAIVTGKGSVGIMGEEMGSTSMVETIRKAANEPTVKAIVLRVDSPGGSALASDLIWQELKKCKKPVIASMGDVAGSGGYYICMSANKIYAEPGTITGSIGVIGGKLVLGDALKRVGINLETIQRGKRSAMQSMTRGFTDEERQAIIGLMSEIYDGFLDKALEGRLKAGKNMSREELKKHAGGRIWSGRTAKAIGLIDEVGTLDDAIADAKKLAGLTDADHVELFILPKGQSFLDKLMDSGGADMFADKLLLEAAKQVPSLRRPLHVLETLLRHRNEKIWLLMP